MKRLSTIFLRCAIIGFGLSVAALCVMLITQWPDIDTEFANYAYAVYTVFIAIFATTIPFYIGLVRTWQLLNFITRGQPFTKAAARAVKTIALAAISISGIYLISMPFFFTWGDQDDAPGLVLIGAMLVGVPLVVAGFATLLYRLIDEAADLKQDSELTV